MHRLRSLARNRITVTWMLLVYAAMIFIVSGMPVDTGGDGLPVSDKLIHSVEYAILGVLLIRYMIFVREKELGSSVLMTIIYGTGYAVTDEIHQGFVGYFSTGLWGGVRNPELLDIAADFAGITGASIIYAYLIYMNRTDINQIRQ